MLSILFRNNYTRNLLLVSSFCFISLFSFGQLERNVTIGGGLVTTNNIPFNGNADFGWTSMIYGSAGFHASDLIIKIGFYVEHAPVNYTMLNQRIWMRLTTATDYTSANYPGTAGFTKVYDGSITYNGSGWAMVTLQTPFAYNNTQNLEVLCENGDGSKALGFPVFRYTDVGANRTVRNFADGAFPSGPGTIVTARPNTKFVFPTPSNTSCLSNTPAADLCSAAPLISNLNGYCGNTKSTYTVSPSDPSGVAFCGNLENTSWLKFVASETTASLNIIVDNCTSNNGIQMRIYETSNCGTGTFTPKSNCWSPMFVQPGIIEATGLTPGNTYYLMIDGYAGDQCDYIIYINFGVQLALGGTYSKTDLSCPTGNDGSISVYPIGGVKPYKSFALSGAATQTNATGVFTGLAAGNYNVRITDQSNAIFDITNITIAAPAQTITFRNDTTICKGASIQLTASGATTYNWTASPADASLTNPAIASPSVQPIQTTVYTLNAQRSASRNLIYNGDFEQGNVGFTTDYLFLSSNPSGNQKAYGIVNNANNWSSFFSSSCTANGGTGNMMVVDGSTTANDTVWCQTVPVLPNTNYTFSYLLQSVGINPSARMDVLINGSPIGNFNAPGTLCNWVTVSHGWNSGVATTAKICIIDRETAQFGNDFAIDDIRFTYNASCSFTKNVTVTVNDPVVPTFPTYGPFCEGAILTQPMLPGISINGVTGIWSPGALNANTPGSFPYTFTPNAGQCATTTGFTLQVNPKVNLTTTSTQNTNCNNTPCTYNGKKVVINELHIQPTSGNQIIRRADLATGGEWIELYNPSPCETLDLSCYMLGNYSTEAGTVFEPAILFLPPGTTIPPLGFLTIGGPSSPATLKPNTLINGLVGNRLYLPGGIFEGGWIGIWDANGTAVDAVYWMDASRNINSTTATASFTTSPGTITNANVPFSCPYRGTLPTARALANSGGPISQIGNIASNGTYQFRTTDGANSWTFNNVANTPNACNSTCATPFTPTCNGTATVTATGGVAPYTYKWNDPLGQTTATATGLCAGTYTVTVKDANNICTQTANVTVTDNCCTTINNPSSAQTLCAGGDPSAFTASTTATGAVKYVYYTTQQTGTAMYNGGTLLGTVTPSGGAISYDAGVLGTTGSLPNIAGVYFVYAILNTTPTDPSCRPFAEFKITVSASTVPTFNPIAPICSGGTFTLPTTSVNGIAGTWLPTINNTTTTTYTFTPNAGQCASTAQLTVTVNQPVTPAFNQVAPICSGGTFTLPTTSNNGITGSWLPAINNTATTTYTFTPDAGQCATTVQMTVTVTVTPVVPNFTPLLPVCSGTAFALPTTSNDGINGTWSPAVNNTATTTYTFTPTAGQCATTTQMTVTVNQPIAPVFTQVASICSGGSFTLPATSNNNITGTWLPAINNTATTTYTFTPTDGQCATAVQMTVTVNPIVTPAFTQVAAICNGGTFTLPTTSNNGITGSWLPAINNSATTTYTFTPDAGQCANTVQMTVTVNQPVTPAFTQVAAICSGGSFTLPTTSNNGITGSWLPAINNTTTTTYTFTPDAGQCATTTQMTVTVNQPVTPTFTQVAAICSSGSFSLPTTSNNNITGSWLPAINNTATTTYTFTPTAGQCASSSQMTVIVNVAPTLVLNAGNNAQSICEGRPITNITYNFGGSATNASVSGLPAGLTATVSGNSITISGTPTGATFAAIPYTVTTGGGNCGTATAGGTITVNPLPVVSAGPDRKVELGKTVVLNGTASGSNNNILWTPPSGLSSTNTLTPVATITQTTTYTLAVTSQFGCTSTDQVLVTLLMPVDVPNVFSPNGDGIHDRWIIRNLEMYDNVRVQIFNRYGSMFFERFAYNSSNAWDGNINGNPAPVGPYYYVITYGEGKRLAGVVSIIR